MKIKWESNSRAKALVAQGKIKEEDVIPRTQTDNFPAETCTVRMAKPREKVPFITLHIRGKSNIRTYPYGNGQTYECAETCRVNFGGGYDNAMCSNGNLDEELSWLDVHNLVEEVKEKMEI